MTRSLRRDGYDTLRGGPSKDTLSGGRNDQLIGGGGRTSSAAPRQGQQSNEGRRN